MYIAKIYEEREYDEDILIEEEEFFTYNDALNWAEDESNSEERYYIIRGK